MIYDCFQFFNELDILKIRLEVMNPIVDKFVISEATETFSVKKWVPHIVREWEKKRNFM